MSSFIQEGYPNWGRKSCRDREVRGVPHERPNAANEGLLVAEVCQAVGAGCVRFGQHVPSPIQNESNIPGVPDSTTQVMLTVLVPRTCAAHDKFNESSKNGKGDVRCSSSSTGRSSRGASQSEPTSTGCSRAGRRRGKSAQDGGCSVNDSQSPKGRIWRVCVWSGLTLGLALSFECGLATTTRVK